MGAPDADFEAILAEQAPLLEQIEAANAWELDSQIELAMDALRLPPPDAEVTTLSGGERRRVALCKLLLEAARPAAARRADQPPRRGERASGWRSTWRTTPGAVLAVTHDRYFLDNVAQWILELDRGRAYPYEGNYSTYLEKKQAAAGGPGQEGRQARQAPQGRARVGADERQGPADQEQEPPRPLRGDGG